VRDSSKQCAVADWLFPMLYTTSLDLQWNSFAGKKGGLEKWA